eukprot:SAG22_NODE_425_length_10628_cov_3.420458_4_plen_380_part_00
MRQRSSLLKAGITAFPCVSLPFLAVPLLSQPTVAISYPKTTVWIKLSAPGETDADLRAVMPTECLATVIYKSDGPLDVALLQAVLPKAGEAGAAAGASAAGAERRLCTPVDLDVSFKACAGLRRGQPVAAYGHALFGTHWRQRRPCLSVGNLAKVIHLAEQPAMLQSSAAVHGGNSGGMLIDTNGIVLGMVTSNVRHTPPPMTGEDEAAAKKKEKATEEGGTLLVELNFSMPLPVLEEVRTKALSFCCASTASLSKTAPFRAVCSARQLLTLAGIFGMDPIDHTLLAMETKEQMDTPDADLGALWALNLEQEQAYQAKVEAAPGGPRFQKFMDEFQNEQAEAAAEAAAAEQAVGTEPAAGTSASARRVGPPMLLMRQKL